MRVASSVLLPLVFFASAPGAVAAPDPVDALAQQFQQPPESARPWVHWFWMDGNISSEGLTADLEAMQRVGVGGVVLMDVSQEIPTGPVGFNTREWHSLLQHALSEANRLGLRFSMNNCPGWTGSGGPWITPELAMQKLVWSKANVTGPASIDLQLPPLPSFQGFSRDVAVLAFPSAPGDGGDVPGIRPRVTSDWELTPSEATRLTDKDNSTAVSVPGTRAGGRRFFQLDFDQPYRANRLELTGVPNQQFRGMLQFADKNGKYQLAREFISVRGGLDLRFDTLRSKSYRILFNSISPGPQRLKFSEVSLNPIFDVPGYPAKSGLARGGQLIPAASDVPSYGIIPINTVTNLTSLVATNGRLHWAVPAGTWTVLRFGHIPTGRRNPAAREGGTGLECDKLSRAAITRHFDAFLGEIIRENGPLVPATLASTHGDSWECGFQNWTPLFREEFTARRGYDPLLYLPAFTGRIVASPEITERFLWDVRRTIADMFAHNYAGTLADLAHKHGMALSLEAYGNGPFDDLQYAAQADVPMSEFWNETDEDTKFHTSRCMASAAHTNGRRIVAAESFTAWPTHAKWTSHPSSLKWLADRAFCEGVNRLTIHRFAHQPWTNLSPGMTMGMWGVHYDRTQTWWEYSKPWHEYLARCQFLLQSGHFVADILYLTEEGAYSEPPQRSSLEPPPPPGHNYDLIHPEAFLERISVKDGRLILPDGMSYRVLILPVTKTMSPALLEKLRELVQAGAIVIGSPPESAPGLSGFPEADERVRQMVKELWGPSDEAAISATSLHAGRIIRSTAAEAVMAGIPLLPEFRQLTATQVPLRYIHRQFAGCDLFFVSNPNTNSVNTVCEFRVDGKQPELWDPVNGSIEPATVWEQVGAVTQVRLALEGVASVFVVFRKATGDLPRATSLSVDGQPLPASALEVHNSKLILVAPSNGLYEVKLASGSVERHRVDGLSAAWDLSSDWHLQFPGDTEAGKPLLLPRLVSWTELPNPGHKFFSGTAIYSRQVEIPASILSTNQRYYLDLGRIEVIAEVKWNGAILPLQWRRPFVTDLTGVIRPGTNKVEIRVANLWPNRLIGDDQFPEDCEWRDAAPGQTGTPLVRWPDWLIKNARRPTSRVAFTTWKFYSKGSPLLPSGLVGPALLRTAREVPLN